jgi:hypothetical protein
LEPPRKLRKPIAYQRFSEQREKITAQERAAVNVIIGELRKAEGLPGDEDIEGQIFPAPQGWKRRVPNTDLWVWYYETETGEIALFRLFSFRRKL